MLAVPHISFFPNRVTVRRYGSLVKMLTTFHMLRSIDLLEADSGLGAVMSGLGVVDRKTSGWGLFSVDSEMPGMSHRFMV